MAPVEPSTGARTCRVVETRHGRMMVNPFDTVISRSIITHGEYSPGEVALLQSMLRPGAVVVEAGANLGYFTVVFAQCVGPKGHVFAFEPQRLVFQMLCANLALNSITCVEARQQGLGANPCRMIVPHIDYERPDNFGALALGETGTGEAVDVSTIDALGLEECSLIKADVQGMELAVLQGATQTIKRCSPILYVENDIRSRSQGVLKEVFALGYSAFWHIPWVIDPNRPSASGDETLRKTVSVNLLCVRKDVQVKARGIRRVKDINEWWRSE